MAHPNRPELLAAGRLGLLALMAGLLAGCHKSGNAPPPEEAAVPVRVATEFANTNGCENPQLIKARLSGGVWYVSMRSPSGAIAVARVSPDGKIISYDAHE